MARVDATGDVGIAAGAEDGRGAGVGIDASEVRPAVSGKQRSGSSFDGGGVVEEESALGFGRTRRCLAAEDQGYELEARRERP